eukprot:1572_1
MSMTNYSTIVSIVYFSSNAMFLFILSFWVYRTGEHSSIKSTSFLKDVWSHRKIIGPVLVHFYDTATDAGVLWYWAELMIMEQNNVRNIESLDMQSFFWWGLSFVLLYRTIVLIMVSFNASLAPKKDDDWYDAILVILDIYILKRVFISFNDAQLKRKEKRKTKMVQSTTRTITGNDDDKDESIEPDDWQKALLMLEAIMESMPQIIFQSVFFVRSTNDEYLSSEEGSNDVLMIFSIVASLISISNKFAVIMDSNGFKNGAEELKPRRQFPDCVQYWYIVRRMWRFCDILSRFAVFVLVWTAMGGSWLAVWIGLVYVYWIFGVFCGKNVGPFSIALGVYGSPSFHVLKYIESIVGLSMVTIFSTLKFDCMICADVSTRQLANPNNSRILIFLIMGWVSFILEVIMYAVMSFYDKIKHDEWGTAQKYTSE